MAIQSKAIDLFLKQSEHGKYKNVNPRIEGDGEFTVLQTRRPEIGESEIGLPMCFDQTIQKVKARDGIVRIVHPSVDSEVPVISTTWVQVVEGAKVTIIEEFTGTGTAVQSGISVVTTAKDAEVDYVRDIRLPEGRAGIFKCVIEAMGAKKVRAWQVVRSEGYVDTVLSTRLLTPGSEVEIMDLAMGSGNGDIRNEVAATHDARDTKSRVMARAMAFDACNISGNGKAILPKIAKGAETSVDIKGLLMGSGGITMVPKLEIEQLDVIAGHGAAIGPLDQEAMFYLNTRGLDLNQSRRLLLDAFVMPLLANLPLETIIKDVTDDLNRHIGGEK